MPINMAGEHEHKSRDESEKSTSLPVQDPRAWVICFEADSDIVSLRACGNNISANLEPRFDFNVFMMKSKRTGLA